MSTIIQRLIPVWGVDKYGQLCQNCQSICRRPTTGGDLMLQVQRGRVRFFHAAKGWGFIVPHRRTNPEVWFHVKYFSGVSEPYAGELKLEFSKDAMLADDYHIPAEHEPVLYEVFNNPGKVPMAIHWLFPEILKRARHALAIRRGSADNPYVRAMKTNYLRPYRPSVIWKGTDREFRQKLGQGFPEMFDTDCFVEQLELDGRWHRMWHPSGWHPNYKRNGNGHGDDLPFAHIIEGEANCPHCKKTNWFAHEGVMTCQHCGKPFRA